MEDRSRYRPLPSPAFAEMMAKDREEQPAAAPPVEEYEPVRPIRYSAPYAGIISVR
ncbi:MAG TPA: hypothetical protein VHK23_05775 [Miltoncostaeaceae bacterium]|jgi:hypothetical protein|nr:hypothetical protein [Miltoncostaeaceae bacterium]